MTKEELFKQILAKESFLCVGLDTDLEKIPSFFLDYDDPIFEFNKRIIDCTKDLCVAYKPNTAFYECYGAKGWESLQKTLDYIPDDIFTIADAKRGDIGNTSSRYAKAFFEQLGADSVTVAPYMGSDSVQPFLGFDGKWVILLALTSNQGSKDFQFLEHKDQKVYQHVLETSKQWGSDDQLMYVVGATHPENFVEIRKHVPDHFLLVPGIGAQGGDLSKVSEFGMNNQCGLLVNSSRGILYASREKDFEEASRSAALKLQQKMAVSLTKKFH